MSLPQPTAISDTLWNGKLFVDYLSEAKRQRIRKKLEKERRHAAVAM